MDKVKYVCPKCGSDDLVWDARAVWNADKQIDELQCSFEFCVCNNCDAEEIEPIETKIDELELQNNEPVITDSLFQELNDILIPESDISIDLLDEAIDLLIDIKDLIDKERITTRVFSENAMEGILSDINNFLNLVDEKNKIMYE